MPRHDNEETTPSSEPEAPRSKEALAGSETRFRALVESSPDVIMTLDPAGTILFINKTLFELTPEEVLGTSAFEHVHAESRLRMERAFREVVEGREPRSIELEAQGPSWWLTRLIPILSGGEIDTVLAIATDISDRKRAEQALRESENKFRALAETTTAAIFIFQEDQMLYANPAAESITGFPHDEILQMRFWDVIDPEFREVVKQRGRERQKGAAVASRWEVKLLTKHGDEHWVDYVASLFEFGGRPAVLGTAVDITERKKAEADRRHLEAQVQHAQKLESLGVLAGGIAHDFNNLLTGILGSASLAAAKLPEGSPAEVQIQRVLKAAEKAADLTSQMLAYAGKGRFVVGPLDLNQLVKEVVPLIQTSISKKTTLQQSYAENLPIIEGDETQLQQVVMNLVTNASEALCDKPGNVSIRTGAIEGTDDVGPRVFFEVTDNGAGMDTLTQEKMFEPFFTTKFTGRGLGLAAVQGIVRAHRGSIRVTSRIERGTTFAVLLPASTRLPATVEREDARPKVLRSTGTILVIDDEEAVLNVARHALEASGFEVLLANDGSEALEIFRGATSEIDAVLLDLSMPHMSGEETLSELRHRSPSIPVVLTSGYSEQEISEKFEGKGLAGFVKKPFRAEELVETIRAAIEESRSGALG